MTIETYSYSEEEEDQRIYEMLRGWCPDCFPPGPLLPKLGVIVYDDLGTAVCFLCADMSNNVPRAFLDHLQTNPDCAPAKRFKATKLAETFIIKELKRLDYHFVSSITIHSGVAALAQSLDYTVFPKALILLHKEI